MPVGTLRDGKGSRRAEAVAAQHDIAIAATKPPRPHTPPALNEPSIVVIREVADLEAENQELRRQLALYEKASHTSEPSAPASGGYDLFTVFAVAAISAFLTQLVVMLFR